MAITYGKPCCEGKHNVTGAEFATTGPKIELNPQMVQQLQNSLPARSNDGLSLGGK